MVLQLENYQGMSILNSAPHGNAGAAIQKNFKSMASRIGPSHFAAASPTANDDSHDSSGNGSFYIRSRWINTATGNEWICTNSSKNNAQWTELGSYTPFSLTNYLKKDNFATAMGAAEGTFEHGILTTDNTVAKAKGSFAQGNTDGGGYIQGYIWAYGKGSFAQGSVPTYHTHLYAKAAGTFVHGASVGGWGGGNSGIEALEAGSFINAANATINKVASNAKGTFTVGYAKLWYIQNYVKGGFQVSYAWNYPVISSGTGNLVMGKTAGGVINHTGKGNLSITYAGITQNTNKKGCMSLGGGIYEGANGTFAMGKHDVGKIVSAAGAGAFAKGGYNAKAYGLGSFVSGGGVGYYLKASGAYSMAIGYCDSAPIFATAKGAIQVGAGTNAEEYSLQLGSGLRIFGGVPAAPKDGDIWTSGGGVFVKSGGSTRWMSQLA